MRNDVSPDAAVTTRRGMLALSVVGLMTFGHAAQAEDVLSKAAEFIRQTGNELARLAPPSGNPPGARERLATFIDNVADVDAVARFCLGRYWRVITPKQQQDYEQAFRQVLVNNVTARIGQYQGGAAKVVINRPVQTEDGIDVPTIVERPNSPPTHVTWLVSAGDNGFKIIDVVAEGMSLRLTQRSDYSSFISRNGGDVGPLIAALRRQEDGR